MLSYLQKVPSKYHISVKLFFLGINFAVLQGPILEGSISLQIKALLGNPQSYKNCKNDSHSDFISHIQIMIILIKIIDIIAMDQTGTKNSAAKDLRAMSLQLTNYLQDWPIQVKGQYCQKIICNIGCKTSDSQETNTSKSKLSKKVDLVCVQLPLIEQRSKSCRSISLPKITPRFLDEQSHIRMYRISSLQKGLAKLDFYPYKKFSQKPLLLKEYYQNRINILKKKSKSRMHKNAIKKSDRASQTGRTGRTGQPGAAQMSIEDFKAQMAKRFLRYSYK